MSRYIDAERIKLLMKQDRLLQGNCEYELWKQEVDRQVNALPHIDLDDYVPKDFHDKTCEAMSKVHQAEILELTTDRPQGEWIKHDEERDYCSRCKHLFKTRTITKQDKWTNYIDDLGFNFCPNCGARMKGADDE